jgi:GT2 family glycosyltransferase
MSQRSPVCSVVIPVYNRSDLLRAVLDGLTKQTISPNEFEVLVCDDGSTEALAPTVASFADSLPRLRHLKQPNQGPAAARNLGIAHAASNIVLFLDSDVVPGERVVEGLINGLAANPDWQGAEAKLQPIGGQDSFGWDAPRSDNGGHYHTAGIAYRKSVLEEIGGLDENFSRAACEDVELAFRVLQHGPIGFVPEAVVYHPRRRRTAASCWKARKNWRYVQLLACRHGFLGWPGNTTARPRLRTALCAAVTLPAGRVIDAIRRLPQAPIDALRGLGLACVDWIGGVTMVPTILLAPAPPHRSQISSASRGAGQTI